MSSSAMCHVSVITVRYSMEIGNACKNLKQIKCQNMIARQ